MKMFLTFSNVSCDAGSEFFTSWCCCRVGGSATFENAFETIAVGTVSALATDQGLQIWNFVIKQNWLRPGTIWLKDIIFTN